MYQVRHLDPALWQNECEGIVLRGSLAKFSQNEDMRVALENTGARRIADAGPHDNVWGIGLNATDLRAAFPTSWYGLNLLGQALDCIHERLRQSTLDNNRPKALASRNDNTGDMVYEVDPITHLRLCKTPFNIPFHVAQLSVFNDSVPVDHAPKVLMAYAPHVTEPLMPHQSSDLVGGVVAMEDATFTTLICRVDPLRHLSSTLAPSLIHV